jgi:uncharacterized membrane protein YfcA
LFFAAAIVAGAINALGGGGGLITFTLLALVLPPVTADATSALALVAGYPAAVWGARAELAHVVHRSWLWLLLVPSLLGGLLGALLLSWSDTRNFVVLVPWLILGGTLTILLRPILIRRSHGTPHQPDGISRAMWPAAVVITFVVALYGGYFGAGIGILMIGALGLLGLGGIGRVVAVKNLLTGCLRGVAVVVLIIEGAVNWGYGLPMALGGLIGGYLGGRASHRANPNVIRAVVITLGFAVAAYYFWRLYGSPIMHIAGE